MFRVNSIQVGDCWNSILHKWLWPTLRWLFLWWPSPKWPDYRVFGFLVMNTIR